MSAMKMQKLVYYSQAWHLVWDGVPLFDERIEAWANGPVVRDLYREHRGRFMLEKWPRGKVSKLTKNEKATVKAVLDFYGDKSPVWLSELTHKERPWIEARAGLAPGARSDAPISLETMADYYAGLVG